MLTKIMLINGLVIFTLAMLLSFLSLPSWLYAFLVAVASVITLLLTQKKTYSCR